MSAEVISIPRAALHEQVAQRLRQMLVEGRIAPGAKLNERELSELLNVSRPYVIQLIEKGELPATKTGTHRRLKVADVLRFDEENRRKRSQALSELAALSQELGLYE